MPLIFFPVGLVVAHLAVVETLSLAAVAAVL
jgi:hypothetical protein